jgi:hypothetical protein
MVNLSYLCLSYKQTQNEPTNCCPSIFPGLFSTRGENSQHSGHACRRKSEMCVNVEQEIYCKGEMKTWGHVWRHVTRKLALLPYKLHRVRAANREVGPQKSPTTAHTPTFIEIKKHTDPQRRISCTAHPALLHINTHTHTYILAVLTCRKEQGDLLNTSCNTIYTCAPLEMPCSIFKTGQKVKLSP